MAEVDRPILISIVAILNIILGVVALVIGIFLVADIGGMTTELADKLWQMLQDEGQSIDFTKAELLSALKFFGSIPIIAGLINILIGVGMWLGWRIMWYIGVIVNIVEFIFAVASIFFGNYTGIIGAIINGLILYYLFRPGVKAFFSV